jgi:hypothetical protein
MPSRAERTRVARRHQRGAALIALLAVIMMGSLWMLSSRLNEGSGNFTAQTRTGNAAVLNRAKVALIGYVAQRAVTDSNPGRLPCPEDAGLIGAALEGSVPVNSEVDTPAANPAFVCSSVGRLPWRTLGLDKLVDVTGEPLWYVVGPSWRLTNQTSSLSINSNTPGDIQVDGQRVVALIIAPGAAMDAATASGCTARSQARATPSSSINAADYLECLNTATLQYTTTAGSTTTNDQFVRVTVDDVLPAIEAVIAKRIESEIVPVLKTVYADPTWGTSSTSPAFAFPAAFADPTASSFQGDTTKTQGLLPFNYHSGSCGGDARCSTSTVTWGTPTATQTAGTGSLWTPPNCSVSGTRATCEGYYQNGSVSMAMTYPANDITKGFRTISTAGHVAKYYFYLWDGSAWSTPSVVDATKSYNLATTGAANFNASATFPTTIATWGYYVIYSDQVPSTNFADHAILSSTDPTTGWFVRNEWYRLAYYAVAPTHLPGGALSCITAGANCLSVTFTTGTDTSQRAILVLAGRSLSTLSQSRADTTARSLLQNYLDGNITGNSLSSFTQATVGRTSNDRFISLNKIGS